MEGTVKIFSFPAAVNGETHVRSIDIKRISHSNKVILRNSKWSVTFCLGYIEEVSSPPASDDGTACVFELRELMPISLPLGANMLLDVSEDSVKLIRAAGNKRFAEPVAMKQVTGPAPVRSPAKDSQKYKVKEVGAPKPVLPESEKDEGGDVATRVGSARRPKW